MKKTFAIITALGLMSFATEKYISMKMSESQINFHWQNINQIKQVVDQSTLPHNQVMFITKALDSLQHDIQLTAKLDSTKTK